MARIYEASDLTTRQRQLLNDSRSGVARIRDDDGTGLVMLDQARFDVLVALRDYFARFISLSAALERPAVQRRPTDFGDFAWLASFDDEDQQEFRRELMQALAQSLSTNSVETAERCIQDWRTTARALSEEKARGVLTGPGEKDRSFEEVQRPEPDPEGRKIADALAKEAEELGLEY